MGRQSRKPEHPWWRRVVGVVLLLVLVGVLVLLWERQDAAASLERAVERWKEINRSLP